MRKPRTPWEALMAVGELMTAIVLGISFVVIITSLENPGSLRATRSILWIPNLLITVPVLTVHAFGLVWSRLLWRRKLRPGEVVVGETAKWPHSPLFLSAAEREGHTAIFGATRSGKSTVAEAMAAQDIASGRPTIVFDPHASMAEALTTRTIWDGKMPYLFQVNDEYLPTLNLLETQSGYSAYDAARTVAEGLSNVYIPYQEELPVRLRNVLETAAYFLAKADEGFTILEMTRYILQPSFRDYLANKVAQDAAYGNWLEPEPALTSIAWLNSLNPTQLHHQSQSTWTRLVGLLSAPDAQRIFGASRSTVDFEAVLNGDPLLVALQREHLHHGAHLANGLVLTWLTHRLRTRPAGPDGYYRDLFIYLDELAEIPPAIFEALLLIAGKRSVRLTLLGQATSMLHPNLHRTLLANVSTHILLRSAGGDVAELANEIFVPPTFDGAAAFDGRPKSLSQHRADLANELRSLPQYHFLLHTGKSPPSLSRGRSHLRERVPPTIAAKARGIALAHRGRPTAEIDNEIRKRNSQLNTRFGALQEFRDDRIQRAMAPW